MIVAKNIIKKYGNKAVLKGVDLEVKKSEIVSLVGASGAGKTTLLHILGTLDKPDSHEQLIINQTDYSTLSDKEVSSFRNKELGFIFQFHQLLPEFNAIENIILPALIAKTSKKLAIERAKELMALLNISKIGDQTPSELSGGEQQRVAVCRALINSPSLVLADEPSGNLDSTNAKELHELFFTIREKLQTTFVIVTHNQELAEMSDRKVVMQDGLIL